MCLFHLQIAKRATVFAATPTEVVLRSTNLSVLRHRSTTLVALLSVMLLAGCKDRELYKSVQGQTVRDLDVSPDGQHLLIAVSETPKDNYAVPPDRWSMRLCEFETGKELKRIDRAARHVAYAPDGTAAFCDQQQGVFRCDPQKDSEPIRVSPLQSVAHDVAWLPDGRLVSAGNDGMRLWDPNTQKMVAQWGKGVVRNIAVSADGRRLVAYVGRKGHDRSSIEVWDLTTRQIIQELKDYNDNHALVSLAISADGKTAVAGMKGEIVIWDVDTGKTRHNIRGFSKVCDLAIFPDGRTLLVAKGRGYGGPFTHPGENAVVLYDVATGTESRQLATFSREKPVSKVALTPDGRFVLAVVGKGDICRWKLEYR